MEAIIVVGECKTTNQSDWEDNGQVHEEVQNDAIPLKTIQAKY